MIKAIEKLMQSNISIHTERSVIERLQVDIFSLMRKNMADRVSTFSAYMRMSSMHCIELNNVTLVVFTLQVSCLTWLNPLVKVRIGDNWEKAISVKTTMIGNMRNLSWTVSIVYDCSITSYTFCMRLCAKTPNEIVVERT